MVDDSRRTRLDTAIRPHLPRLLTPALVIDLDAVVHNVRRTVERVGDTSRWRPHVKTVKQSAVIRLLFREGIRHIKCATTDELALVLRSAALENVLSELDVLVAYPLRDTACRAALDLRADHRAPVVSLLVDSPDHCREVDALAGEVDAATPVDVFLDVNVGMNRTGSRPQVWQEACSGVLDSLKHLRVVGLHGYDGHLAFDQRTEAHDGYDALRELAADMPVADDLKFVVTSGTHSYVHALDYPRWAGCSFAHQVSPGTIVLSDLRSEPAAKDIGLRQAAFVATRVVSAPTSDRITLDAGSKGLSPDMAPPACAILGHPGLVAQRASEEHRPVVVQSGVAPAPGDLLWLVPEHVCTTVNLYREAVYLSGDEVVGHGPIEAMSHPLWAS